MDATYHVEETRRYLEIVMERIFNARKYLRDNQVLRADDELREAEQSLTFAKCEMQEVWPTDRGDE